MGRIKQRRGPGRPHTLSVRELGTPGLSPNSSICFRGQGQSQAAAGLPAVLVCLKLARYRRGSELLTRDGWFEVTENTILKIKGEDVSQVHQNTAGPDMCYHSGIASAHPICDGRLPSHYRDPKASELTVKYKFGIPLPSSLPARLLVISRPSNQSPIALKLTPPTPPKHACGSQEQIEASTRRRLVSFLSSPNECRLFCFPSLKDDLHSFLPQALNSHISI